MSNRKTVADESKTFWRFTMDNLEQLLANLIKQVEDYEMSVKDQEQRLNELAREMGVTLPEEGDEYGV